MGRTPVCWKVPGRQEVHRLLLKYVHKPILCEVKGTRGRAGHLKKKKKKKGTSLGHKTEDFQVNFMK
jgi:hypothetical protein